MPIRNFLHVDLFHLTLMWFHRRKREKPVRPMLLFTEYAILTFVWKTLSLGILGEELNDVETTLTKKMVQIFNFLAARWSSFVKFQTVTLVTELQYFVGYL